MNKEFAPRSQWEPWAYCYGYPEKWFFAESGQGRYYNSKAKELCADCPVQLNCLNYAIAHDEMGIWGGLTERERKQLPILVIDYVRNKYRELNLTEDRKNLPRIFAQVVSAPVEHRVG